jgi:hypothetical protein
MNHSTVQRNSAVQYRLHETRPIQGFDGMESSFRECETDRRPLSDDGVGRKIRV